MARKIYLTVLVFAVCVLIACAQDDSVSGKLLNRLEDYESNKLPEALEKREAQLKETQIVEDSDSRTEARSLYVASRRRPLQKKRSLSDQPKKCCVPGFTHVNLKNGAECGVVSTAAGIEVLAKPTPQYSEKRDCSKTALLKVTFEKLTEQPCDFCLEAPYCGRRMLKIDLELSPGVRSGWTFNIGDSATNNGWAGDGNTQWNDGEVQGVYPDFAMYKSDICGSGTLQIFNNAMNTTVNHVTLYVSNQHLRVTTDQGFDEKICSKCFFALNGQPDPQGINEIIYLGLNRVVTGTPDRMGVGVCSATLTWVCPQW